MTKREGHICPVLTLKQIARGLRSGRLQITELGLERLCTRCGEFYPLDTEFWYQKASSSTGVQGYCNACYQEQTGKINASDRKFLAYLGGAP